MQNGHIINSIVFESYKLMSWIGLAFSFQSCKYYFFSLSSIRSRAPSEISLFLSCQQFLIQYLLITIVVITQTSKK